MTSKRSPSPERGCLLNQPTFIQSSLPEWLSTSFSLLNNKTMFRDLKQSFGTWCIRKIQKYGPHSVSVLGKTYEISEEVFNPKYYYTSEFMARHIDAAPEDAVLDMGTGSGIQAVTAAQKGCKVVAVDINPEAVKYAKRNVK